MVEKFSQYESEYLTCEGVFEFEVLNYELKDSSKGTKMVVFTVDSDAGQTTIYKSLVDKARWSYNAFIKACKPEWFDTREKLKNFMCDYELIGQQLVGAHFLGTVEQDTYIKEEAIPREDGTFERKDVEKVSYKITKFDPVPFTEVGTVDEDSVSF